MGFSFVCPCCGNSDPKYIGYRNNQPYCRKCISFRGKEVSGAFNKPRAAPIEISYELSPEQKNLSNQLLANYKNGVDSLVHAVCGSGKTEIVLNVIQYAIESGDTVGFAIPRRDVVIELYERFKQLFTKSNLTCIYGGHTEKLNGDLIILTTHQLFRFKDYFDLLIVDEVDAFPYAENDVLQSILLKSVKGRLIMMSATPSEDLLNKFNKDNRKILELFSRFHNYPLPVPIVKINHVFLIVNLIKEVKRQKRLKKRLFIFVPTIDLCEKIFKILHLFFKDGNCVHSKCKNRAQIIEDFKNNKYQYLVTTSILERGVTVEGLNVIIFEANHSIYNCATLVQISGRVGRRIKCPKGEVIYLAKEITIDMEKSIREIESANKDLQNMF